MTRVGRTAAAVVVALVFAAVWFYLQQDRNADDAGAVVEASAAGQMAGVEATGQLLSYDHRTLEEDVAAARELIAPMFLDEFSKLQDDVIAPATRRDSLRTVAVVKRSAVVSANKQEVEVLVFLEQSTAEGARKAEVTTTRAVVTMVRHRGSWMVGGLRAL